MLFALEINERYYAYLYLLVLMFLFSLVVGILAVIHTPRRNKTMRELTYGIEGKAANLKTFAVDEPGHGGACHVYHISGGNPDGIFVNCEIEFQDGPINADGNGVNGIQHEDLLAIIIDRIEGFQSGPYACESNAAALKAIKHAMEVLNYRTRSRIARGVEGTHSI